MVDRLCCTEETNITLQIKYVPIKSMKIIKISKTVLCYLNYPYTKLAQFNVNREFSAFNTSDGGM